MSEELRPGSFVSLTSRSGICYEGVVFHLNVEESTTGLENARAYSTNGEGRNSWQISQYNERYEFIIFHAGDIKDCHVMACPPPSAEKHVSDSQCVNQVLEVLGTLNLS